MSTDTFDDMAEQVLFPEADFDDDFVYEDLDGDMDDPFEEYCDYCERTGHTFRGCARRDDAPDAFLDMEYEDRFDIGEDF